MPILSKTIGEPTREDLIKIHRIIIANAASVMYNLGRGIHGHLVLMMAIEDYIYHTGHVFVPPPNPGDYPPMMGTAQEQALRTKKFQKNQVLFCSNAVDWATKKKLSNQLKKSSYH